MDRKLFAWIAGALRLRQVRLRWKVIGTFLGLLALVLTAYALIRPAMTLGSDPEAHTHTAECYETRTIRTCGQEEAHSAACETREQVLTCELPEYDPAEDSREETPEETPAETEEEAGEETTVPVTQEPTPAQTGDSLKMTLEQATEPDDEDLVTLKWSLSLGPADGGTTDDLQDLMFDWDGEIDPEEHWITDEQLKALRTALEASGLPEVTLQVTVDERNWVDYIDSTGQCYGGFRLHFAEPVEPRADGSPYSFSYYTTGRIDPDKDGERLRNHVSWGGLESDAHYRYERLVVKLNGDAEEQDQTISITDPNGFDGVLYWYVKVLGNGESVLTVTDQLPEGICIQEIGSGSTPSQAKEALGAVDDSRVTGTGAAGEAQTVVVQLPEPLAAGESLYLCYSCRILEKPTTVGQSQTYRNTVTVQTASGALYGSDTRAETVQVVPDTNDKVAEKSAKWDEDTRRMIYSVTLDPAQRDLKENGDTLALSDVLSYYYNAESYAPIEVTLDRTSVVLYQVQADGTETPISGWDWTYEIQDERFEGKWGWIRHTISGTVPDGTWLRLEYAYEVALPGIPINQGYNFTLMNQVTLTGDQAHTDTCSKWQLWTGAEEVTKRLTIYAVDRDSYATGLAGAVFTLYDRSDQAVTDSRGQPVTFTTDSSGQIVITGSGSGVTFAENTLYYLAETQAPRGYRLPERETNYYFYFSGETGEPLTEIPDEAVDLSEISGTVYVPHRKLSDGDDQGSQNGGITVQKQWLYPDGTAENKENGSVTFELYQVATPIDAPTGIADSDPVDVDIWLGVGWESGVFYEETLSCVPGTVITITMTVEDPQSAASAQDVTNGWRDLDRAISVDGSVYTYTFTYTVTGTAKLLGWTNSKAPKSWDVSTTAPDTEDPGDGDSGNGDSEDDSGAATIYGSYTIRAEDNWSLRLSDLPTTGMEAGRAVTYTYYVVEQSIPNYTPDYENNEGISEGTITIRNTKEETPDYTLPNTGSGSATLFTTGGGVLCLSALLLLYDRRKKRRRSKSLLRTKERKDPV